MRTPLQSKIRLLLSTEVSLVYLATSPEMLGHFGLRCRPPRDPLPTSKPLKSIGTEASTLRTSIHQLQHLMQRDPVALSTRWDLESMLPQTFEAAIQAFDDVLDALLRELEKFKLRDKAGQSLGLALTRGLKVKLLWNESAMQDLLVQLRAQQQSLHFLLDVLHMETSSDIRNAVYENQALLKKLARSKNSKRKLQSVEKEEIHLILAGEYTGENSTFSEDDLEGEPPAKRRSISPEEGDQSGSVSPSRTRSGRIYYPSIGISAVSAPAPMRDGALAAKPAALIRKQRQVTSTPHSQQSRDQRQERRLGVGRYGLGRSLSPASSTLSSPLTQSSSFTYVVEGSSPGWPGSSPNSQVFESGMSIDTPTTSQKNANDQLNPTEGKEASGDESTSLAEQSRPEVGKKLAVSSTLPDGALEHVEVCMDPQITKHPHSTGPRKLSSSNTQEYRSPQVDSDSEDDRMDFPGKTSSAAHNDPSPNSSTTALPVTNKDMESNQLTEKSPNNVRPENRSTSTDVVTTLRPYSVRGAFAPRYNSSGYYATAASVSRKKTSWAVKRRNSFSYRSSYGDLDDNEYEYVDLIAGGSYSISARKPTRAHYNCRRQGTCHYSYPQTYQGYTYRDDDTTPQYEPPPRRRREPSSVSRPSTSRPSVSHKMAAPIPKATEADAKKHRIPPGYSLKYWDPSEEPIILLGSVFDANSFGKWLYDWTVYHHGPVTPIADMAGEMWLLLIQLAGKVKRADECMPRIRTKENREMVEDFIESGERLTCKLKKLLKACEKPMLEAGKKYPTDSPRLGRNAGTEFVDCIFGSDRQLEGTEKFMASIRLWSLRFDANCEDILRQPGQ